MKKLKIIRNRTTKTLKASTLMQGCAQHPRMSVCASIDPKGVAHTH